MTDERNGARRVCAHLTGLWCVGVALTAVQFQAVLVALFTGGVRAGAVVLAVGGLLAVLLLVPFGRAARSFVPLARSTRGLWGWAAGVYALGTVGAFATVVVNRQVGGLDSGLTLYPLGGLCYALAAAWFLPGLRARIAALGATAALAVGGGYALWEAARPPTLDEWIAANDVDRAMLRVGDPPPGYTLHVLGASVDGFGADYSRPGTDGFHLGVARPGQDTRRVDARGCPVPFGDPVHCSDDGGGRQLVTYQGDYPRQELRLRVDGLVHTVTLPGTGADLPAARHVLSTLRPATEAELAGLLGLPMP
ncbi:hypothetical protein [Allostreptomyces psammosilenae]|uniref:Uncharacterized protein n=1 Tax=Allostreptomyces psammosilenae TaxID=1892865 RepID=A0A852ZQI3_9ACTN|nr:hypothetical protein [Allostreptomyces psammosilenae]NYI04706.1 hypothetical protein [Allostreptomyces psammosilenae]